MARRRGHVRPPIIPPPPLRSPHMWIRQCELDAGNDTRSPIPTRIASNEEFIPPPQTPQQKAVEERLTDLSDRNARALGMDRRWFLRTGPGMAAALIAM